MLDRIAEHVREYLADEGRVPRTGYVTGRLEFEHAPWLGGRHLLDRVGSDDGQVHRPPHDRDAGSQTAAREIQQIPDHVVHAPGAARDDGRQFAIWLFELARI